MNDGGVFPCRRDRSGLRSLLGAETPGITHVPRDYSRDDSRDHSRHRSRRARTQRTGQSLVVGSHYAGALIAKDCGDTGPERDRRYEVLISHDRTLLLDAARSLLSRLVPLN